MHLHIQSMASRKSTMAYLLPLAMALLVGNANAAVPADQPSADDYSTTAVTTTFTYHVPTVQASTAVMPTTTTAIDDFYHIWPIHEADDESLVRIEGASVDEDLKPIMPFIPVPPVAYPAPQESNMVSTVAHGEPMFTTNNVMPHPTSSPDQEVSTLAAVEESPVPTTTNTFWTVTRPTTNTFWTVTRGPKSDEAPEPTVAA